MAKDFEPYRERLRRVVALRLDRRLAGRVSPSDVVQETWLEATRRLPEYERQQDVPLFVWLRWLALQKIAELARRHLDAGKRDARREVALGDGGGDESGSAVLENLTLAFTTPSVLAARREEGQRLADALARLAPEDREIIVLRHFERLDHREVARDLGISQAAASKRYQRALERLRQGLAAWGIQR